MKPDFLKILSMDSLRITADIVTEAVGNNPKYFKEVLDIVTNSKSPLNWRAARVIEFCSDSYPELFTPYIDKFVKLFPTFETPGLKRSFPKIFKNSMNNLSEENKGILIDACFKYMLSGFETIAVRVNCMNFLYYLSKEIPEITGELHAAIKFRYDDESKAYKARARMILKKMNL